MEIDPPVNVNLVVVMNLDENIRERLDGFLNKRGNGEVIDAILGTFKVRLPS